jgi:hypothetical protein
MWEGEMPNDKLLKPDDFPVEVEGDERMTADGQPIARAKTPAIAEDIADRLNEDDYRRAGQMVGLISLMGGGEGFRLQAAIRRCTSGRVTDAQFPLYSAQISFGQPLAQYPLCAARTGRSSQVGF